MTTNETKYFTIKITGSGTAGEIKWALMAIAADIRLGKFDDSVLLTEITDDES